MKKLLIIFLICVVCVLPVSASDYSGWPRIPDSAGIAEYNTAVWAENLYYINCRDIELRLDIPEGGLSGLTLTRLPKADEGELTLNGIEAPLYTRLTRAEIDNLVYEPAAAFVTGRIGFIPEWGDMGDSVLCIASEAEPIDEPKLWGEVAPASTDMKASGSLAVYYQGDGVTIKVYNQAKKGRVLIEGDSYIYTASIGAKGQDKFTLVAVDSRGLYSEPCEITVNIDDYRSK